ncbi:pyrimidine dimer DNA glycosylase/endonuclease V [Salinicoccus sp. Marseille-QA3877]
MQIFRVSEDHQVSAQFLDNRRLSKQVLELYQIIKVCLGALGIVEVNTRYLHHPVVKAVYNEGQPYLMDTLAMLDAMDAEHLRRGGKRSEEFRKNLGELSSLIKDRFSEKIFSKAKLPPFYIYGTERCYTDEAYKKYEKLLFRKWNADKIPPRCNWKGL